VSNNFIFLSTYNQTEPVTSSNVMKYLYLRFSVQTLW